MPKYTKLSQRDEIDDEALDMLVDDMYDKQQLCMWTSIELHDKYKSFSGLLTWRQMLKKLHDYFNEDVVVVHMDECASLIGFRSFVSKTLQVVMIDSCDEYTIYTIVQQVTMGSLIYSVQQYYL